MAFNLLFKDVEVVGSPINPLFNARDVARLINDTHNYERKLKSLNLKDIIRMNSKDTIGRDVETSYLTEIGLYRYLLQSKNKAAEEFQYSIYEQLVELRKQTITDEMMKNKILTGKLEQSITNSQDMLSGEFRRTLDHSPTELANFYIAKYFTSSDNTSNFTRDDLNPQCIQLLIKIAEDHFYSSNYVEYQVIAEGIIENQRKIFNKK